MAFFHEWEIPIEKEWDEWLESGISCRNQEQIAINWDILQIFMVVRWLTAMGNALVKIKRIARGILGLFGS